MRKIKIVLVLCIAILAISNLSHAKNKNYLDDFESAWSLINDNYVYLDVKTTDWDSVYKTYKPLFRNTVSDLEFTTHLYRMLEELYDSHIFVKASKLKVIPPGVFYRQAPEGSDLWAEFRNGNPVITELVNGMSAEQAGLKLGMEVLEINNVSVKQILESRLGDAIKHSDPAAISWALNTALAGAWGSSRNVKVRHHNKIETFALDLPQHNQASGFSNYPHIEWKTFSDQIGYINIRNLQDTKTITHFDDSLEELRNSKGLVIDLRETRFGGNTFIARAILGRFVDKESPYQKHLKYESMHGVEVIRSWLEMVSPRGEWQYNKPIVVLVNHWTASMGEGMAIAFDGLERATIIGVRMGQLAGAVQTFTLPNTGIVIGFPNEKLFHIDGTPREHYVPNILVDLFDKKYAKIDDPILNAGINSLLQDITKSIQPFANASAD